MPSNVSPIRSATFIEGVLSGWIKLMTCRWSSEPNAYCSAAFAPSVAYPYPTRDARASTDLEGWPALGIEEPDAPNHRPSRFFLNSPVTVPTQLPVADEERHAAPCLVPRQRLSGTEIPHHDWIGTHVGIRVDVAFAPHAQLETLGFEFVVVHTKTRDQKLRRARRISLKEILPDLMVSWSPGLLVSWSPGLLVSWSPGLLLKSLIS